MFILTMAAIGCSFSKGGNGIAQRILRDLDGPGEQLEEVVKSLSETQLKVLFGEDALKAMDDGNTHDSD